nr:MAG TPA: response regulator [Bacteriophage sp.]
MERFTPKPHLETDGWKEAIIVKLKFREGEWLMKLSKLTKPELEEIFRNANFTEEEEKVFWDLSKGISQKEISFRHSISVSTVERRVRSIKNKIKRLEGDRFGAF